MRSLKYIIVFSLSIFLLQNCAEEANEETQDAHVCEHLLNGPVVEVIASTTYDGVADMPDSTTIMHQLHTRYDIVLADSGYVRYKPISTSGDYVLYLDQFAEIIVYDNADKSVVPVEEVVLSSDDCDLVAYKGIFELDSAQVYIIEMKIEGSATIGTLFPPLSDQHEHE